MVRINPVRGREMTMMRLRRRRRLNEKRFAQHDSLHLSPEVYCVKFLILFSRPQGFPSLLSYQIHVSTSACLPCRRTLYLVQIESAPSAEA